MYQVPIKFGGLELVFYSWSDFLPLLRTTSPAGIERFWFSNPMHGNCIYEDYTISILGIRKVATIFSTLLGPPPPPLKRKGQCTFPFVPFV